MADEPGSELHPDFAIALWVLGLTHSRLGHHANAIPLCDKTVSLSGRAPGFVGMLGLVLAIAKMHRPQPWERERALREPGSIPGLYPGKYNVIWASKDGFADPFPAHYPENPEGGQAITIDGDSRFDIQLLRP